MKDNELTQMAPMDQSILDRQWMEVALEQATLGAESDEVPIGAVLIKDNELISSAYNQTITQCDPSAHAEILALRYGAKKLNNYRLINTTLYVTLEPCLMCLGAIINSRVSRIVYGAKDTRFPTLSCCDNQPEQLNTRYKTNHWPDISSAVLEQRSVELLRSFFRQKR